MIRRFSVITALIVTVVAAATSSAAILSYTANLDGPSEFPPNASPGTGLAQVDYDDLLHTLHVNVTFSGLLGTTTASHIHGPTTTPGTGVAGVITTTPSFAGFPLGVTSGSFDNTLDLTLASSWNPSFVTNNGGTIASTESVLAASLAGGTAYLNIHTTAFSGGEIRGFLVPEPATLAMIVVGSLALLSRRRAVA